MLEAERYCSQCHGQALVGGGAGEPSCYQCHGKTWTDDENAYSVDTAPSDHTELNGRFYHNPGHANAETLCSTCHGESLEGAGQSGAPPCYLCHGQVW